MHRRSSHSVCGISLPSKPVSLELSGALHVQGGQKKFSSPCHAKATGFLQLWWSSIHAYFGCHIFAVTGAQTRSLPRPSGKQDFTQETAAPLGAQCKQHRNAAGRLCRVGGAGKSHGRVNPYVKWGQTDCKTRSPRTAQEAVVRFASPTATSPVRGSALCHKQTTSAAEHCQLWVRTRADHIARGSFWSDLDRAARASTRPSHLFRMSFL